jgi:hypothetical protein
MVVVFGDCVHQLDQEVLCITGTAYRQVAGDGGITATYEQPGCITTIMIGKTNQAPRAKTTRCRRRKLLKAEVVLPMLLLLLVLLLGCQLSTYVILKRLVSDRTLKVGGTVKNISNKIYIQSLTVCNTVCKLRVVLFG